MADEPVSANNGSAQGSGVLDPTAGLERIRELLSSKDDTSRFAGLAILKSVLDNQPLLREDIIQVTSLWEAIPPKFLDRLLWAGQNRKVSRGEARNMVDIAVAVLHTFALLLPAEVRDTKRFVGRLSALVNALVDSSPECTVMILQTILALASQKGGALELINTEDVSPLTEIAPQQSMVLDIFSLAWAITSTEISEVPKVRDCLNKTIPMLISSFRGTDAVTFIAFIGDILPKLPIDAMPKNPEWLESLVTNLRRLITSRPTQAGRSAYTQMAAALMRAYPLTCPSLLFKDPKATGDSKPFSYLFINLILIDIRSSLPLLLSKLNSPEYPATSKRLSSAFDIVLFFIGFLMESLDHSHESSRYNLSMPPDLLLKLRKTIAETMSMTIEYLRDRWDASVAGAPGLHPSARESTANTSEGMRLTLTWDSFSENAMADPLINASIRTLATWLREDENENLRKESAGLMDMLVELYQASVSNTVDFRQAVLHALEVILNTGNGIDAFIAQNGWDVLSQDLKGIVSDTASTKTTSKDGDEGRGHDIIRLLLVVVDSESATEPQEKWMEVVKTAAGMKPSTAKRPFMLDLQIDILQLAAALLTSASKGMQKRYVVYTTSVLGLAAQLRKEARKLKGQDKEESLELLNNVVMTLENLR